MIRNLFLTCIATFFVGSSGALLAQQGGFFIGAEGSYNMTIILNQQNYGQKEMDYDGATLKPSFAAFIGYDINGKTSILVGAGLIKGGQKYKDSYGNSDNLAKDIQLNYLSIPISVVQVFSGKDLYKGTNLFVRLGAQFNILQSATVEHFVNDKVSNLQSFANYAAGGGAFINFNESKIKELTNANGDLDDDAALFQKTDIKGILGIGARSYLSEQLSLDIELRTGISITDINATDWRIDGYKDGKRQTYAPSRNAFIGINVGISYRF